MTKQDLFAALRQKLKTFPSDEIEKSFEFYDEIINDQMEDGKTEEEAVETLGEIENIMGDIIQGLSMSSLVKASVNKRKNTWGNKALWITLTIIGSVVWAPLLLAVLILILAVYISIWSIALAICCTVLAVGICGILLLIGGVLIISSEGVPIMLMYFSFAFLCIGITLILIKPMILLIKQLAKLTKFISKKIKSLFIPRREK